MKRVRKLIIALAVALVKLPVRPLCLAKKHPFRTPMNPHLDKCLVCGQFVSSKGER